MSRKGLWIALVLGLLFFLGSRVLSLGMAEHYARTDPERALVWRGNHSGALNRLAQRHAEMGQWRQSVETARSALRANPLDGQSLRILAQAAEAEERTDEALVLFRKAMRLAPRDQLVRFRLLQEALKNRNAAAALTQLDALLRLNPELLTVLQPQLDLLAVNPAAQNAMVDMLNRQPPWRSGFLAALAGSNYPTEAIMPIFAKIKGKNALSELEPWLSRLRRENHHMLAYLTWVNLIPEAQRSYLGNVFDGGFELPQEAHLGPFAWNAPPLAGTQAYWATTRGTIGQSSYFVQFEGRRTPFGHLWQSLALPAGNWRLTWRARGDRLDTQRGLVWRVLCEPEGTVLAESEPMMGRFDWRQLGLAFEVPASCPGQRLLLTIPARIPAETVINGTFWLDDVQISPISGILSQEQPQPEQPE